MENDKIMLSEDEREYLVKYVSSGIRSSKSIRKAKVILALDRRNKVRTLRINEICESENLTRQGLKNIRTAFLSAESIDEFLARKKRTTPPVEAKITGEVEAKIIATACGEVPEGNTRWTLRLLADKVVELGFIDSISYKSVQAVLKKHRLNLT